MIQTVRDYQKIVRQLPELIEKTNYKMGHFIGELGMAKPTFYRKIKKGNWTIEEVLGILKLVHPEEYYREQFKRELAEAEVEAEKGILIKNDVVMKQINDKLTK